MLYRLKSVPKNSGRCRQLVAIRRWLLAQVSVNHIKPETKCSHTKPDNPGLQPFILALEILPFFSGQNKFFRYIYTFKAFD